MHSCPLSNYDLLFTTAHLMTCGHATYLIQFCAEPVTAYWLTSGLSVFEAAAQYKTALEWLGSRPDISSLSDLSQFLVRNSHVLDNEPALFWQQALNQNSFPWLREKAEEYLHTMHGGWLRDLSTMWRVPEEFQQTLQPTMPPRLELQNGWEVVTLAFSPDGTLLYSGDKDGAGRKWSVDDGRLLHEFIPCEDDDDGYTQTKPSSDGQYYCVHDWWDLCMLSTKTDAVLWRRKFEGTSVGDEKDAVFAACKAFTGQHASLGKQSPYEGPLPQLSGSAFTKSYLITLHDGGYIARWSQASGELGFLIACPEMGFNEQIILEGEDRFSIPLKGGCRVFDAATMQPTGKTDDFAEVPAGEKIVSPDKTFVANIPGDSRYGLLDYFSLHRRTEGKALVEISLPIKHGVTAAVFMGEHFLAVGTGDGSIFIYDLTENRITAEFAANVGDKIVLAAHAPRRLLAAGGANGNVRAWQWPDGNVLPAEREQLIQALHVQSDGEGTMGISTTGGNLLLQTAYVTPRHTLAGGQGETHVFSPTLQFRASYDARGEVSVRDSGTADLLGEFSTPGVLAVAWGAYVLTVLDSEGILSWVNIATGENFRWEMDPPEAHKKSAQLRVSADGETVLVSWPGHYFLLDRRTGNWLSPAPDDKLGDFTFEAVDERFRYGVVKAAPRMVVDGKRLTVMPTWTPKFVYDLRAAKVTGTLEESSGMSHVVFSRKRALILAANETSLTWNEIPSGKRSSVVANYPRTTAQLAMTKSETRAVLYQWDKFLHVWDLVNNRRLATHFAGGDCSDFQFVNDEEIVYLDAQKIIRVFKIVVRG